MKGRRPTTTPEQDAAALDAYGAGAKLGAICQDTGLTMNILRRILRNANVPRRPSGRPPGPPRERPAPQGRRVTSPEQDAAIIADYMARTRLKEIGRRYHISQSTVRERLAEAKVPRRGRGRPRG